MIEVTVGVIARNEEKHIAKLLRSLLNLNFPKDKYEIIFVDGDSSDATLRIAKQVLSEGNVRYRIIEEGKEAIKRIVKQKIVDEETARNLRFKLNYYGPCFARNLVIEHSDKHAKYIAFIDADCVADKDWLKILYERIKNASKDIAGVGGLRLIAKTNNRMELLINSILTSCIATLGNPAFCRKNTKYVESIPNYNAIYRKNILEREKYDVNLVISDDVELNYRLRRKGYKFLYEPNAKVYHHETSSVKEFLRNMFRYGVNVARVVRKHKRVVRIYVPFSLFFVFSPVLSLICLYLGLACLPAIFYGLYFIIVFLVFAEVLIKTKDFLRAWLVFILLPSQHFAYGLGVLKGLFFDSFIRKD